MPTLSARLRTEGFFAYKERASEGMCWVRGCRNRCRRDTALCHKHHMQRWRAKNKASSAYATLRDHARARGIAFTITPDYFRGLTDAFDFFYQNGGAARGEILTIDRVNPAKGYEPGNCRVVSLSANVVKGNRERYLPEHVQALLQRQRAEVQADAARYLAESQADDGDELPF